MSLLYNNRQLFTFNKPLNAIPEGIGAITNLKSL